MSEDLEARPHSVIINLRNCPTPFRVVMASKEEAESVVTNIELRLSADLRHQMVPISVLDRDKLKNLIIPGEVLSAQVVPTAEIVSVPTKRTDIAPQSREIRYDPSKYNTR